MAELNFTLPAGPSSLSGRTQRTRGLRAYLSGLLLTSILYASHASAEPWRTVDPVKAGWPEDRLDAIKRRADALRPTALIIVHDGSIIASWGDVSRKVNMASVRKSLLSALYGIAVSEGRIDLSGTLAELGVDDKPPGLTDVEKSATVRDLITARSGIYHPAAHETGDIRRKRPPRGTHPPGSFWFYNNWDFNALGTIYRQRTGEDIFESFSRRIAKPVGMEDFSAGDGRYAVEQVSRHPAYVFNLSARDAARFGQLFLDRGRWAGRQIIPSKWVAESTRPHSWATRNRHGYGYMWWTLPADTWGPAAFYASGYGGQIIAVVPAKRLVVVQTVNLAGSPNGIRTSAFIELLSEIASAAP